LLLSLCSICSSHKILVYNPKFAHSHVNYLGSVADLLQEAGHSVTSLMPNIIPSLGNSTKKSEILLVPPSSDVSEALKSIIDGKVDFFTYYDLNPIHMYKMSAAFTAVFT
ncbi:hypothetical protein PMAYCL1PPCAC_22107, partial [Pristionchus mayeri]